MKVKCARRIPFFAQRRANIGTTTIARLYSSRIRRRRARFGLQPREFNRYLANIAERCVCNSPPQHVMDIIQPVQYVRAVNEADITGGRSARMSSDYYVKLGDGSSK